MPLRKFSCFLLFAVTIGSFAQNIELSPLSEVSVLTCGSGDEIYSKFGHSAIRVEDPTLGIDAVYNYGTFDFTTPNFILKFARGKLNYILSRQSFPYFLKEYEMENRWVKSQQLELSLSERQALFNFLETNYLPQNRDYKYDFFYNNCVTKIWDVLYAVYGSKLAFDPNYLDEHYTHRQLIHQKVKINSWLGFGIDLALGSVIDDVATPKEHMFLPDYTMLQLEHSTLASEPLALEPEILFESRPVQDRNTFFASPAFWLTGVLLIILILTYLDFKNNTRRRWLDFMVFFGTGAAGLLILFLWFFTDHTATANNFNFLWAFPINLIIAFVVVMKRGPNWIAKYVLFLAVLLFGCVVLWLMNIQVFSPVAIPIWLALAVRYLFLYWSYKTPKLI